MKKILILLIVVLLIGAGGAAYFLYFKDKGFGDLSFIGLGKAPEPEKVAKTIKIEVPPEQKKEVPTPPVVAQPVVPPPVTPSKEVKPEAKPAVKEPAPVKIVEPEKVQPKRMVKKKGFYKPWAVHVASYTSNDEADVLMKQLREDKYNAYVTKFNFKGKTWYRVRIGFYSTEREAKAVSKRVEAGHTVSGIWIVKPNWKEIKAHDP